MTHLRAKEAVLPRGTEKGRTRALPIAKYCVVLRRWHETLMSEAEPSVDWMEEKEYEGRDPCVTFQTCLETRKTTVATTASQSCPENAQGPWSVAWKAGLATRYGL